MIAFDGVSLTLKGAALLKPLSFSVPEGGSLALVGPGGAGKTVILKLLCGLLRPTTGAVSLDSAPLPEAPAALAALRARIGMVFQNNALFDALTVFDNVAFPLRRLGQLTEAEIAERVHHRLSQVYLQDAAQKRPAELSGGMKKRVCLARATVHAPPILLLDDPTAGLDPVTTNRIFRLIATLRAEAQATVLLVSHEVSALPALCEQVLLLDRGEAVFSGDFAAARAHPDPRVAAFLFGEGIE